MRLVLSFLFLLAPLITDATDRLPVEAFSRLPAVTQVQLSPDGNQVAYIKKIYVEEGSGAQVQVYNFVTNKAKGLIYAKSGDYEMNWIRWANNEDLLVSARFPAKRYGVDTTESRLLSISSESGEITKLLSDRFLRKKRYTPQFQDQVIDYLPDDPDHILMSAELESPSKPEVMRVNVKSNRVQRVFKGREGVLDWITDRQHNVRIGLTRKDARYQVIHRAVDSKTWQVLWEFDAFSEDVVWPMSFGSDPNYLYVRAYHDGRLAVFKVNVMDRNEPNELVFSNANYDINGSLIYSEKLGEIIGLRFKLGGRYQFWHADYQDLQERVDLALPDNSNFIYDLSQDERKYIVLSTSDTDPGSFYVGDRDANSILKLSRRQPDLPAERMVPKTRVRYEARDGLDIEAYLTLPESEGEMPPPAIIFPHGGPISFDGSGFNYWTQYFASRGYAVLQMNFRGSAGYGYDFMKSGLQSWGLEMQNDVEDGTRWLIENKMVDPDRICVVGASYGGYAALMEAARNPDLYQCAVSFAGVTDVAYLVRSYRRYSNYEVVKEQVGSDFKALRRRSPLTIADDINIPVLLGHGTNDQAVKVEHSRKMRKALTKGGKQVEYLEFKDGDHYLSVEQHRIDFFKAMDRFLGDHLQPGG